MKKILVALALVAGIGTIAGCQLLGDVTTSNVNNNDNGDRVPTPTPTPSPTPTPVPLFPTGAPCASNLECESLNCTGGVCQ